MSGNGLFRPKKHYVSKRQQRNRLKRMYDDVCNPDERDGGMIQPP